MKASAQKHWFECLCDRHRRHQALCHVGTLPPAACPTTKCFSSSAMRAAITSSTTSPRAFRRGHRPLLCPLDHGRLCRLAGAAASPSAGSLGGSEIGQNPLASRQGFLVLLFALSVAGLILQPASNALSAISSTRPNVYGQEAIHGLVADPQQNRRLRLQPLAKPRLLPPIQAPSSEFWEYSHPSVQHRAQLSPPITTPGPTAAMAGFLQNRE